MDRCLPLIFAKLQLGNFNDFLGGYLSGKPLCGGPWKAIEPR